MWTELSNDKHVTSAAWNKGMHSASSTALFLRSTLLPLDAGRCLLVLHYLRRRYR